jgi:hypothetical protein
MQPGRPLLQPHLENSRPLTPQTSPQKPQNLRATEIAPGRDENGRFKKGEWKGGPGNQHIGKVHRLRAALLKAVDTSDMKDVMAALIRRARRGDVRAIKELFDRTLGKAPIADYGLAQMQQQIENLKTVLREMDRPCPHCGQNQD